MASLRHDGRRADQLRKLKLTPGFVGKADGSCLVEMGGTRVICTATFVEGVPAWRADSGVGWVTAEYGMLPASTGSRKPRPIPRPDGRSVEIQRIIGRVLRSVVRFSQLGENTVFLDCDVLEADGGTRAAAINGAYVALAGAIAAAATEGKCDKAALSGAVAAVSVGVVAGRGVLDLDYSEDSLAEVDMNVAMTAGGKYVEVQGSAERGGFDAKQLDKMLTLARRGIRKILTVQRQVLHKGSRK